MGDLRTNFGATGLPQGGGVTLFDQPDEVDTVKDQFDAFDKANPRIYSRFKDKALDAVKRGKTKISSKMIINVIRWDEYLDTDSDDGFKINDKFTPYYSRKFIEEFPEHSELFNFRTIRKV